MKTMWGEVWNPIKIWVMRMEPQLKTVAKVLTGMIQALVGGLARFFETLTPGQATLEKLLHKLADFTISISGPVIGAFLFVKNVFMNILVPVIIKVANELGNLYQQLVEFVKNAKDGFKDVLIGATFIATSIGLGIATGGTSLLAQAAIAAAVTGGVVYGGSKMVGGVSEMLTGVKVDEEEEWKKALTKMGIDFEAYDKEQKRIGDKIIDAQTPLLGIKNSINAQTDAWRDKWNSIDALTGHIADNTASIDAKTIDTRDTAAGFLGLTNDFLSQSMDQILGLTGRDDQGFMHSLGDTMETLVDLTAEGNSDRKKGKGPRSVRGL